jgi:uncharacterized protein with ParB-like and HNH nuclease domain
MCIHNIHFIIGERAEREENIKFLIFIIIFMFFLPGKNRWKNKCMNTCTFFPNAFLSFFRFSFDFHSLKKRREKRIGFIDKKEIICVLFID